MKLLNQDFRTYVAQLNLTPDSQEQSFVTVLRFLADYDVDFLRRKQFQDSELIRILRAYIQRLRILNSKRQNTLNTSKTIDKSLRPTFKKIDSPQTTSSLHHNLGGCMTEQGFFHIVSLRDNKSVGTSTHDLKYIMGLIKEDSKEDQDERQIQSIINNKDQRLKGFKISDCIHQLQNVEEDIYCTMKKTRRLARLELEGIQLKTIQIQQYSQANLLQKQVVNSLNKMCSQFFRNTKKILDTSINLYEMNMKQHLLKEGQAKPTEKSKTKSIAVQTLMKNKKIQQIQHELVSLKQQVAALKTDQQHSKQLYQSILFKSHRIEQSGHELLEEIFCTVDHLPIDYRLKVVFCTSISSLFRQYNIDSKLDPRSILHLEDGKEPTQGICKSIINDFQTSRKTSATKQNRDFYFLKELTRKEVQLKHTLANATIVYPAPRKPRLAFNQSAPLSIEPTVPLESGVLISIPRLQKPNIRASNDDKPLFLPRLGSEQHVNGSTHEPTTVDEQRLRLGTRKSVLQEQSQCEQILNQDSDSEDKTLKMQSKFIQDSKITTHRPYLPDREKDFINLPKRRMIRRKTRNNLSESEETDHFNSAFMSKDKAKKQFFAVLELPVQRVKQLINNMQQSEIPINLRSIESMKEYKKQLQRMVQKHSRCQMPCLHLNSFIRKLNQLEKKKRPTK